MSIKHHFHYEPGSTSKQVNRMIRNVLNGINDLAYLHIKEQATALMVKHKNLSHFCMAMGTATFYINGKVELLGRDGLTDGRDVNDLRYLQPLLNFINEFDNELSLTGQPLRLIRQPDGTIKFQTEW